MKEKHQHSSTDLSDTSRWTSRAYAVRFDKIQYVQTPPGQEAPFTLSAWGISNNLCGLLSHYSSREVQQAAEWLTTQQNALVADVLEQMTYDARRSGEHMPPLHQLFITIDSELFLPRGLRMMVTCVTNIVPRGRDDDGLDKFVAVLDPGEVRSYIMERRGSSWPAREERMH